MPYSSTLAQSIQTSSTDFNTESEICLQWFAVATRSRHEKCLNVQLRKKGIETFLPLRQVAHKWSDRRVMIQEPVFPGYLFVKIPYEKRLQVLNTPGAATFVGFSRGLPCAVPEQELNSLQNFVKNDLRMDPFPYLRKGLKVYVRSGPLRGIEGYIVRKDNHCRLVLSIDLLMQSVSVAVDESNVELI